MLKCPFLHSVENWKKCDGTILLQQGATPMHMGKGGGEGERHGGPVRGQMSLNIGDI